MKKSTKNITVLAVLICCLLLCASCAEKNDEGNGENGTAWFDLSDAKNLYLGSVGTSKGIGNDFAEVTKDNNTKNVSFNFPVDTRLRGYTALPDGLFQLNEDYILVRFGLPLILVRTSDGFGICLNHISSGSHSDMHHLSDEYSLKRQFKINDLGDVYFLGRYLTKEGDMTGFKIMKFSNSENKLETFFTYDTGKSIGASNADSILVDMYGNTAASCDDQTNTSILVAVPRNGTPVIKEFPIKLNGSFIGPDGVFYFISDSGYVSVSFDTESNTAEMSNLKSNPEKNSISSHEFIVINGKIYGLGYGKDPICITALNGTVLDVQKIKTGLDLINGWDYAGNYIYISGCDDEVENAKLVQIDTTDNNSVSEVVSGKKIKSFTASEEHGITFESVENGSYSLWVQDLLSTAMTKSQESNEAFEDLVKVE